jgi:CRP/FNR family transcriptional regulator, cyclic AMP receptor protein
MPARTHGPIGIPGSRWQLARGLHDSPVPSHAVLSFPGADLLFRRLAVEAVDAQRTPGQPTWTDLRLRYPHAELHHQRAVVVDGKAVDTWFAFRDGRDQPSCPADPWWTAPGAATATLTATGRVTNRSRTFQQLFGGRNGTTVHAAADLLSTTLVEAVTSGPTGLWPAAVASTGLFQTRTGEANLEFRIDWDDDGPDRHRFAARTFDERATSHYDLALRGSSLGVLPPMKRVETLRSSRVKDLGRGERLQDSVFGAPWAALVLCGIARVYVARDSVEPTVAHAASATLLGSHIGPDGSSLVIGLQAMTPCRVVQLDPARVARMMKSDLAFAAAVAADARETLAALIDTYAARSAASLGQRLARDLITIADLHGEDGFIPMTEQQLADGLGSIRESVARTIGDFRRRGWIATTRYGLVLRDREAVAANAAVD